MIEATPIQPPPQPREGELRRAARDLEIGFLSEMLRHAGLDEDGGGTGPGGAQMASFRTRIQAEALVDAGGIGLAQALFESLAAREGR
ncbi:MAG: rod-binding protein [Hasllibacter sp.]